MTHETKITVDGKDHGLLFGYTSYKRLVVAFYNNPGVYMNPEGTFKDEAYVEIVHGAYENYCLAYRKKAELTYDDVSRWLDTVYMTEEGKKQVNDIFEMWLNSNDVQKMIDEGQKKNQSDQPEIQSQTSTT